ncbi:MAG TPA: ATP-binding protein [Candidatus Marinimicrobia bacterium]|nr:ATP-binding protein [Candidatus Neomarinimicrobiota bacterium]
MYNRAIENKLLQSFGRNKAVVLSGPRQVGKTTLARKIADKSGLKTLWLNGDEPDVRHMLTDVTSVQLKSLVGKNELVVIDEAQRITNIGITLKLMVDELQNVQIFATGSSSFELANRINEPLTGRKIDYFLFPFSFKELSNHTSILEEKRNLVYRLIYGSYPDVVNQPGEEPDILKSLSDSYLYKDLLAFEQLKKPAILEKLLQALALQIGNQVSYHELGQLIGADNQTIERYIDLLEKSYVIFRLGTFSRNLRNELKKTRKIYFYDNGIRNAIIKNYSILDLRTDKGALWENYLMSERMKANQYARRWSNTYFWRTHAKQEIDYIEEREGRLFAYEFKFSPKKKMRFPTTFSKAYPQAEMQVITRDNYIHFIE